MATLHDALRNWANGTYPTEAAVELLIRQGKAIREDAPWIIETELLTPPRPRMAKIDTEKLLYASGAWSGGEQRIIRIAISLLDGVPVNLSEDLPDLDREHLSLVLAAIAHAGGSHEHSGVIRRDDGTISGFTQLASLYPWAEAKPTHARLPEGADPYIVPIDPMDDLDCDSCQ